MSNPTYAFTRLLLILFLTTRVPFSSSITRNEISRGFSATPNPSISAFQNLLTDSSSNFSLAFLHHDSSQLWLAIIHLPSSEPVWHANTTHPTRWSESVRLSFNGSLHLSDHSEVLWSTKTDGDRLRLSNGNLQILNSSTLLWQSFDFPSDTLLENQNFTVSMSLHSAEGLYSMKLMHDSIGLFAYFGGGSEQMYWKRTALQARAQIVDGQRPIYARVSPDGFLGLYQNEKALVDVIAFRSFQRSVDGLRRVRLEEDGNLRAHYWNSRSWVLDFEAITEPCELPSGCGAYGICRPGKGCECLDNRTEYSNGGCFPGKSKSIDFCSEEGKRDERNLWELRRVGIDLPFKELMEFEKVRSLEECKDLCDGNCGCWGAVYNNVSGNCYRVDYPIQTMVGVGDERKVGLFKMRRLKERKRELGFGFVWFLLSVTVAMVLGGLAWFGVYGIWRRRKEKREGLIGEEGLSPGPYRDLGDSFRSIELCKI